MSFKRVITGVATPSQANKENAELLTSRNKNLLPIRKMLFSSSLKVNNENAGFLTPLKQNILSRKKLFASSSKVNNQHSGYLKPRNQNICSKKTLFPDNGNAARDALRDLKNTTFTPSTIGSSFVDETKTETESQSVSLNNDAKPKHQNTLDSTKTDLDNWHENIMLSDDQFNFLFMEPNVGIAPPTPSPERASEYSHRHVELSTPTSGENLDYKSTFDSDDYEIPCLNMSFFFR